MAYKSIEIRRAKDRERYFQHRQRFLLRKKKYRIENIEKFKANDKKHYQENRDRIIEQQKKRYSIKKEDILAYHREYYKKNTQRISEEMRVYYKKNRGKIIHRMEMYRKTPDYRMKARIWFHDRRTLVKSRKDGTVSLKTITALLLIQDNKCAMCHIPLFKTNQHLDHIIPLCVGGTHSIKNVQWLCKKCNLTKPKKVPQ